MAEHITENLWRLDIPLEGNPLKNLNSYLKKKFLHMNFYHL